MKKTIWIILWSKSEQENPKLDSCYSSKEDALFAAANIAIDTINADFNMISKTSFVFIEELIEVYEKSDYAKVIETWNNILRLYHEPELLIREHTLQSFSEKYLAEASAKANFLSAKLQ